MWYPGYDHVTIKTPLKPDQVVARVSAVVQTPRWSRWLVGSASSAPFEGRVDSASFKFHRTIHGRNSFVPIMLGRIIGDDGGARIDLRLRLHVSVMVFAAVWSIGTIRMSMVPGRAVAGVVLFCIFWVMCTVMFNLECQKSKKLLAETLESR